MKAASGGERREKREGRENFVRACFRAAESMRSAADYTWRGAKVVVMFNKWEKARAGRSHFRRGHIH